MKKSGWILIPVAFFLLLNFSISPVKYLFIRATLQFTLLISLFLFLRHFDLKRILRLSVGGVSLVIFIYGIVQRYLLFPIYLQNLVVGNDYYSQALKFRIESGRIFSIFSLPTLYAIVCGVLMLFIVHYLIDSAGKYRLYWIALLCLGVFNLALTQSFGGVVCFGFGLMVYFLVSGILKLKYIWPVVMTISLFFFLIVGLRFSEARKLEPVKLRISNWNQAVRMMESSPFWGIGLGNYEARISQFSRSNEAKSIYAHNFFLQISAETGVFFPVLMLLALYCWRKKLIPMVPLKEYAVYISIACALLIYSSIDIGFFFFPAAILFVISLSQLYPQHHGKPWTSLIFLIPLLLVIGVFGISDSNQREADLLVSQNKINEAKTLYERSFSLNPFNYKAHTGYSRILLSGGNMKVAKEHLVKAAVVFPQAPLVNYLLSKIEYADKHYFRSYYHASAAYRGNQINQEYKRWYEFITTNLQAELSKSQN